MKKSFFVEGVCYAFIMLFVYAAVSKLMDYQKFQVQLLQSPLLHPFAISVSWFIPATEFVIAGIMAVPRLRLTGLYAGFTLMVLFTSYIIVVTRFSDHIPCACGGILGRMGWSAHLIFNLCWVALATTSIFLNPEEHQKHLLQ